VGAFWESPDTSHIEWDEHSFTYWGGGKGEAKGFGIGCNVPFHDEGVGEVCG